MSRRVDGIVIVLQESTSMYFELGVIIVLGFCGPHGCLKLFLYYSPSLCVYYSKRVQPRLEHNFHGMFF
jgi:hypothetical protein